VIIGILQPGYLPWLGFFEQMYRSDVFVIYDDVQYDKEGWRNRNRIKTANGVQWMSVPVLCKFSAFPLITEIKINNKVNWRRKHLFSIRQNYSSSPFYKDYIELFEEAYSRNWEFLIDLDMFLIRGLNKYFGMEDKKIIQSSTLNIKGDRMERLINLCKLFGANTFYEGIAGKDYIEEELFRQNGIRIEYQDYKHPIYQQLYGEFVPYLSVIDLLFNHGKKSISIITDTGKGVAAT
jgi:WbqC-like protein family